MSRHFLKSLEKIQVDQCFCWPKHSYFRKLNAPLASGPDRRTVMTTVTHPEARIQTPSPRHGDWSEVS